MILEKIAGLFVGKLLEKNFSEMASNEKIVATVRVIAVPTVAILVVILILKGGNEILVNRLIDLIGVMIGG